MAKAAAKKQEPKKAPKGGQQGKLTAHKPAAPKTTGKAAQPNAGGQVGKAALPAARKLMESMPAAPRYPIPTMPKPSPIPANKPTEMKGPARKRAPAMAKKRKK